MEPNQSSNFNNSYDSQIINYMKKDDSNMDIKISSNELKNSNKEQMLSMELKNIQMLILQRSLFILKKKFEINKKPLEVIYQKYKDENYMKLRCISVDYLTELYIEIMETIQFTILPYNNFNELFSADLMTELNKDKSKIYLKELVKFTNQNIEKYNRIYFEKKMKKKQLLEENKKKINVVRSIDEMEEITNDKTIVRKDKRGKIINNFEEMLKNNIELTFGPDIIMTINEDDMSILNNTKLLYSDVIPLIIADFLQNYLKENKNIALISTSNIADDAENVKLNEKVKTLFDNEIFKFYQNLAKFDPDNENKEKLKNLLLEIMNTDNQIKIYQKIILEQTAKGMNVKHLLNMVKKLNEQKSAMQKKINQYNNSNNSNSRNNLNNNIMNNINDTKSSFGKENKKISETNKSNSNKKSGQKGKNKLGNNNSKISVNSNNKIVKLAKKRNSKEFNENSYQIDSGYSKTDGNYINSNINNNSQNNINKDENFYYQYGVLYPESKEELRNNSLLEIFYFYTKQHSFIGHAPTFEQFLKSEENLDLAEFGKFCVEFKILVKPQKIAEIFKKTSENSKNLSYKKFCEALKKLSVCANDEKKKYLMDRIKIYEMKLKEIKEKEKKDENNVNNNKKEENLSGIKDEGEAEEDGKCLDEKENNENNNENNENKPSNENNNENEQKKEEKKEEPKNEEKNDNENNEEKKEEKKEDNNENKEENKDSKEQKETTNIKYYHQSKLKNAKNRKPIVKKKLKLVKPKTSTFLMAESKEDLEEKISKLKEDYDKLNKKTSTQLIEEFYQYLELDDINAYRKKMFGYVIPFRTKDNYSRFPIKSVQNPPKQNQKIKKEMHKILIQRHEDLVKEKEMKQIKEKNILFEKRMKKFEEDKKKIVHKMNMKNDYLQMKKNEEDYQKEKINKLTWEQIQNCDYDTFILNEKDKNRNNFNDIFTNQNNQFEGDDLDYLKTFKVKKGFNDENNKINNTANKSKFDSNLSRISSGNNGQNHNLDLDISNAIESKIK